MISTSGLLGTTLRVGLVLLFSATVAARPTLDGKTDSEYTKLAKAIVADLNTRSAETLANAMDWSAIFDDVLEGLNLSATNARDVRSGLESVLPNMGRNMTASFGETYSIRLLRVRHEGRGANALIRLNFGEKGLTYWEVYIREKPDGTIVVRDFFDFSTAQTMTGKLEQIFGLVFQESTLYSRLLSLAHGQPAVRTEVLRMMEKLSRKDFAGFLADFQKLPESIKKNRMMAVLAVAAATNVTDMTIYAEVLGNLARYHGDDPTLSLLLLDHYIFEGDYDGALAAAIRFEAYLDMEDPAWMAMKANVYNLKEEWEPAYQIALAASKREPELEESYWPLLTASANTGRYARTVATLGVLEQDYYYEFSPADLVADGRLGGFVSSREFKAWSEGRN